MQLREVTTCLLASVAFACGGGGASEDASFSVRRVWFEPSAPIKYISRLPSRSESKAMRAPSAENEGSMLLESWAVRFTCSLPSAFMTKTSGLPSRSERKAIFDPSGDPVGWRSL